MASKILGLILSSSFERVHEKAHTNKDFVAVSLFSQVTRRGHIAKKKKQVSESLPLKLVLCFTV